jgi:dihydroorotate dehydrogenase electron transfer subunit
MIEALNTITAGFKMPMKVLLEKRMGCGIGVCMSCVCATNKNNRKLSSRVCMDGPLFDAEDIDWRQI